jgi:hypothetical protein
VTVHRFEGRWRDVELQLMTPLAGVPLEETVVHLSRFRQCLEMQGVPDAAKDELTALWTADGRVAVYLNMVLLRRPERYLVEGVLRDRPRCPVDDCRNVVQEIDPDSLGRDYDTAHLSTRVWRYRKCGACLAKERKR